MILNKHSELIGRHATFSPSQPAWLRYDTDKLVDRYLKRNASILGTEIHEFAATQILLHHKITSKRALIDSIENYIYRKLLQDGQTELSDAGMAFIFQIRQLIEDRLYDTVKNYINDGVGYKMVAELPLYFSDDFFGTADSISFRKGFLRIHDLKTGTGPVHIEQLMIYAALFCLEYKIKPSDIDMELRIYQNGDILVSNPSTDEIVPIMDTIITFNKALLKIKRQEDQ